MVVDENVYDRRFSKDGGWIKILTMEGCGIDMKGYGCVNNFLHEPFPISIAYPGTEVKQIVCCLCARFCGHAGLSENGAERRTICIAPLAGEKPWNRPQVRATPIVIFLSSKFARIWL